MLLDDIEIRYSELPMFMDSNLSRIAVLPSFIVWIPSKEEHT
jgi:hypothetical protein